MKAEDFSPFGNDLFGDPISQGGQGVLASRFLVPPFSVLNSREGIWQERKAAWISMGIESEVGREGNLLGFSEAINKGGYGGKEKEETESAGTSVFDPVLAELCYRWWCPPGGQIIDPFAGGSVRGIVAGKLGRKYWGCDIRKEQVAANWEQGFKICPEATESQEIRWECGDAWSSVQDAPGADFIFSCPPYGDLERYSDLPRDLSSMSWEKFKSSYSTIIEHCCDRLKANRFAAFVVGDFRGKDGFLRDFVSETIRAFTSEGLRLYNEAILVTPVGTCAMRGARIFDGGRKLTKSHQNLLVFCKGDWKKAHLKVSSSNGAKDLEFNQGQLK